MTDKQNWSQIQLKFNYNFPSSQSMNTIDLRRLKALEQLNETAEAQQFSTIVDLVAKATPSEIIRLEAALADYHGRYQKGLEDAVAERKLQFSESQYLKRAYVEMLNFINRRILFLHNLKYYYAMTLFCSCVFLLLIVFANSTKITQKTSTYVPHPDRQAQFTNQNFMHGILTTVNIREYQEQLTAQLIPLLLLIGAWIGMLIWAFGFRGFKGQIKKDLERLENQRKQIEGILMI